MADMLSAPAGTSWLGFHLPTQMGSYKISSQSLGGSPAAPSQTELRKRELCQPVSEERVGRAGTGNSSVMGVAW